MRDIPTDFGSEFKHQTVPAERNKLTFMKSNQDGGRYIEFQKMKNVSGLDEGVCTNLVKKMNHGHVEMIA